MIEAAVIERPPIDWPGIGAESDANAAHSIKAVTERRALYGLITSCGALADSRDANEMYGNVLVGFFRAIVTVVLPALRCA